MTIKVAINGFGRIGRNVFRALYESGKQDKFEVVAVNDLGDANTNAHLLQYDTAHGRFSQPVTVEEDHFMVGKTRVRVLAERDPSQLPWSELGVDVVLECTGFFASKEKASAHLTAGARKVIISAPGGKDVDATVVYGVNHDVLKASDTVISNASCTTNCLAPLVKPLHDAIGLVGGLMTTIHAVTATQPTVDGPSKKDFRGGRGGFQNIIPASTGAAKAVGLCIPEVQGKLTGMAMRVPTANVSVVDLTVRLSNATSYDAINQAMKSAADGTMKGILGYTEEDVVSSDFNGSSLSSIYDSGAGIGLSDRFFKVVSWYDNEMGYSCRLLDLIEYMDSRV